MPSLHHASLSALALTWLGMSLTWAASPSPWPAWRGPNANGVSPNGDPPTRWSETENVRWKVKVPGRSSSTPILCEDLVIVQTAAPLGAKTDGAAESPSPAANPASPGGPGGGMRAAKPSGPVRFSVLALDLKTGKTVWDKTVREEVPHEGHHQADGTYASASPVTDGRYIFAYFGSRGLHCLDLQGNLKWSKDLGKMQIKNAFGEGSSPALSGSAVVVNWDHEGEDFIAAFDKATGAELWRQPREEDTSWATPLVVETANGTQVITSATRKIRAYDVKTGKLIWECGGMTANTIPSPVTANGVVYALSGFRGSALLAIRLDRTGDLTGTDGIVWRHNKSTPYVPSPLLYDNRLYFLGANTGRLSCFDARTGQALIDAQPLEALEGVYASPVGARNRAYFVGRNGATVVLAASDKLEILATNQLKDQFDASPAVGPRELLLRGRESLYCLAEK